MNASTKSGPLVLGLTGSIGMGKSTVASMFKAAGIPVFDADAEVRKLQGPDGPLVPLIEAEFPGSTGPQGVDRDALGKLVFGNPQKLARLEAIVHPAVAAERAAFLKRNAGASALVFDIPLLFERGGHQSVDAIVVVSASAEDQRARVLARPGMTEQKFEHILSLQTPDLQKRERADYIINTSTSLAETEKAVKELVSKLLTE